MELQAAQDLAIKLMTEFGLRKPEAFGTPLYWSFAFNKRIRRVAGRCSYKHRLIELSAADTVSNSPDEVEDIIRHEIAHAIVGPGHKHNMIWKYQAIAVGAKPERCKSSGASAKGRYRAVCTNCSRATFMYRKWARPERRTFACVSCCQRFNFGRFSVDYAIEFTDTKTGQKIPDNAAGLRAQQEAKREQLGLRRAACQIGNPIQHHTDAGREVR